MTSITIFFFTIIIAIGSIINSASISSTTELPDDYKVVFVSAVFRHGDRTPISLYPGTLTTLADVTPPGLGQLTAAGKERARQLGVVLHQRYDNLLGEIYNPNELIARSTDIGRAKMTLGKVLEVLYPGEQSIPIHTVPTKKDIMMLPIFVSDKYQQELAEVKRLENFQEEFRPLNNQLFNLSGHNYEVEYEITGLYHQMTAETYFGLKIPSWARDNSVMKQLEHSVVRDYEIGNSNTKLRKLNGGFLLRNITESMTGIAEGRIQDGRKIQLFGGHEANVIGLLAALGLFKPHIPAYSSCVMVELLKNSDSQYYVQVLYYLGIPAEITTLQIPGCSNPCPLSTFVSLMKDVTPTDDDLTTVDGAKIGFR